MAGITRSVPIPNNQKIKRKWNKIDVRFKIRVLTIPSKIVGIHRARDA